MTKSDAMAPIIGLEATVTGGRTIQAQKRGGKDEARERLIEETTGAVVWLGGVKVINDYIGDPILNKLFGGNFDVGTDKVLRTPFDNFMKKNPPKGFSAKQVAIIKAVKVLASVLIADAFIGLVVPPINQKLTRTLAKQKAMAQQTEVATEQNKAEAKSENSANPSFKGGGFGAINAFTNAIENTNTGKLLSTDAGLVSGRMYSARNNEERREIAIRDIGSIYFYMWAQGHVGNLLNYIESGRFTRLNPTTANILDEHLTRFLESKGGEMGVEEFQKAVLGKPQSEIKLPENIKFETAELGRITKFMDKFRSKPTEPLQAIKLNELKDIKELQEVWSRVEAMSKLQPLRQGEAVITKQQIIDALNVAEINNPDLLNNAFSEFTGGKLDEKTGKYIGGASTDEFKFVSNKKLYNLKSEMENYVKDLCKGAKNGKINKEALNKMKNKNLTYSGINFAAGFAVAALFLSTLIPKFQYWFTRKTTGKDEFPGTYGLEEQVRIELNA